MALFQKTFVRHVWKTYTRVYQQRYCIRKRVKSVPTSPEIVACFQTCQHTCTMHVKGYTLFYKWCLKQHWKIRVQGVHTRAAILSCLDTWKYTCEMYPNRTMMGMLMFKNCTRVSRLSNVWIQVKTPGYCTWPAIHVLTHVFSSTKHFKKCHM